MNVLHVVPTYLPAYRYGGPIYSVHGLCKALARRKHTIDVFTTNVDGPSDSKVPLEDPIDIDGVKVTYFATKYSRFLYVAPSMAKMLSKKIKLYDLIHIHSIFRYPTSLAASVARRHNIPYIISPRGMLIKDLVRKRNFFLKTSWIYFIERKNLELANGIHVTSSLEAREVERFHFNLPHIYDIPNGAELPPGNPTESKLSPNVNSVINASAFILFLGRINWKKGLDRLIQSLTYLPDIYLIVAGDNENNYRMALEKLAVKHKVKNHVVFTDRVDGQDKAKLLINAKLLVLPSYSENFGNVILEAMSLGCPVVVTPEVGLAETVKKYNAGIVVCNEPETLGKAISNTISNSDLLQQMGANGKKAFENHFSWEKVVVAMESMYQDVVSPAGKNA